jgi:thioredoxin
MLEFYADWCAPCLKVAPIMSDLAREFKDKIRFAKVNVDVNSGLVESYEVSSIPTVVFVKGNREFGRITGAVSEDQYRAGIINLLKKRPSSRR